MASERTIGVQLTPPLAPVSYAAAEVTGSGNPPLVALRAGGEVTSDEQAHRRVKPGDAQKLRPQCTLIFMEATTAEAVAIRDRDILALRAAVERDPPETNGSMSSRTALLAYLEEERSNYVVACLTSNGDALYISPNFSGSDDIMRRGGDFVVGSIDPDMRFWAFGLPGDLPVQHFPDRKPKEVELLDLLGDFTWVAEAALQIPDIRALPVVDPILILRGTTQLYAKACDRFLTHVGEYKSEEPVTQSTDPGESPELPFYKSRVADVLRRLTEAQVSDGTAKNALKSAAKFKKRYDADKETLLNEREAAAHNLIGWLESDSLAVISSLFSPTESTLSSSINEGGYLEYVNAQLLALGRLAESERGKHYLVQQLQAKQGQESAPEDTALSADLLFQYVLPSENPSQVSRDAALNVIGGVVGLWLKLFPLILERAAKNADEYINSGKPFIRVNDTVKRLVNHLDYLFGESVFQVLPAVGAHVQVRLQDGLGAIYAERVLLAKTGLAERLTGKAQRAAQHLESSLDVLNAVIAFASCFEAMRDKKYDLDHLGDGVDVLKAFMFIADQAASIALKRDMLDGPFKTFLEKLGPRVSGVGTALDIVVSHVDVFESYKQGDYDAALAKLVAARVAFWALGASGPVGWSLLAISFGVGLYADSLKDGPFDKLAKFSAFGDQAARMKSEMDDADKAWTMANSHSEWNPHEKTGLQTWLLAAAQLAYSFEVRGFSTTPLEPAAGHIRIDARQLLPSTCIHLQVDCEYANWGQVVNKSEKVKTRLWVKSLLNTPALIDYDAKFRMDSAVKVLDGHIVEITLRLVEPFTYKRPNDGQMETLRLYNLTCKVRLDVHGDGDPQMGGDDATLIVPNTKAGKRWVEAVAARRGEVRDNPTDDARMSFNAKHHA